MAKESDRAGLVGAALGAFFICILAGIWLRLIMPLNQNQNQHEQELDELAPRRKPDTDPDPDLERGLVGGEFRLRDPNMFIIPEEGEGGEFNPTTHHVTPMVQPTGGKQHGKKVQAPPKSRPRLVDTMAEHNGGRDSPRHGKEHVMSETNQVFEDDDMVLMPPGASLSQGGSKCSSQRTSFLSDPFDLSHFLSPRRGSHAPKPEGTQVGPDALPAMPKPAVTRESRDYSISRRPAHTGRSSTNGPSSTDHMPEPSEFEIVDAKTSSKDDVATRWKPAPPKASRYRGLSATRPGRKPQSTSLPRSHIDSDHVTSPNASPLPTVRPPLPAFEILSAKTRPDSWENFSSAGDNDTDGDPNEWASQVYSTMTEPEALHVEANKAPARTDEDSPGGLPAWPLSGPFPPSPRIFERKASLPGRKSKFFEVDVDGVPAGEQRDELALVRKCVALLREGARTPTILTSYGEAKSPAGSCDGQDLRRA